LARGSPFFVRGGKNLLGRFTNEDRRCHGHRAPAQVAHAHVEGAGARREHRHGRQRGHWPRGRDEQPHRVVDVDRDRRQRVVGGRRRQQRHRRGRRRRGQGGRRAERRGGHWIGRRQVLFVRRIVLVADTVPVVVAGF